MSPNATSSANTGSSAGACHRAGHFGPDPLADDDNDWSLTLAYFYLDLLQELKLDAVHLVGLSLGGWIAAELAVRSKRRLASLTLAGAAGLTVAANPPTSCQGTILPTSARHQRPRNAPLQN